MLVRVVTAEILLYFAVAERQISKSTFFCLCLLDCRIEGVIGRYGAE